MIKNIPWNKLNKKALSIFVFCIFLTIYINPAYAQNISASIDFRPQGFIPLRESNDFYSMGFGGNLSATFTIPAPFYLRGALGYLYAPTLGTEALNLVSGRAGIGVQYDINSTLLFQTGISAGGFFGMYDDLTAYNPSLGVDGNLNLQLNSGFRLGIGGGYDYHVGTIELSPFSERAFLEGAFFSVSASFVPGAGGRQERRPRLHIDTPLFQPVFPVFYRYYNENPLGSVTITNNERRPISNVTVSFFVPQYMESPKASLRIERMAPGESVEVPILALFRNNILTITEGTTVSSQIIVEYEEGGDSLSTAKTESVVILQRNNMTWDDDRKAAAFVTPNDPTILRFARNITAAIRGEGVTAINERLRIAMALFQALNLYGMDYSIDPDSSYIELSSSTEALDSIQFPQQTLDFRAGDCDDLSVLYSALLEAVGIRSAFITIPGHIYMAFALDMDEREAVRTFSRPEDLIFISGEAWLPVEITLVQKNFLDAWTTGAKQWRENSAAGTADIYVIRDAWRIYPPTGFASEALNINIPQTPEVVPNYTALLRLFIDREIAPRVTELNRRIQASGENPRLVNSLGALYARYGLYEEAEREFLRVVRRNEYLPSLVNLGNIYLIRNDLRTAFTYYDRARQARGDDPSVLISLARVHFDLSEYDPAVRRYREAEIIAPEIAREYSYIVSENRDTARASSAQQRQQVSWNEE